MTALPSTSSSCVAASGPRASVLCTHCGLAVPPGLVKEHADHQFCCHGCETAYAIIHSCGLDRYYALRNAVERPSSARRVRGTGSKYAEFDDATFQSLYCTPLASPQESAAGLMSVELYLEGVHCAACVWLVERLPRVVDGVVDARLDLRQSLVRIAWDPSRVPLSRVAASLDSLGYVPHAARGASVRDLRRSQDRKALVRLGVAGACAANVMLIAVALYAGLFSAMAEEHARLFRVLSMGISLVSLAWPGSVFFRGAWAAIRTRSAHLDLPIALGLGAGAVWGVYSTLAGLGEVYFDSLSVLVFLLLVGRYIQQRQQRGAADALELLFSLTPARARLVEDAAHGTTRDIPTEALNIGDLIEVRAGESIPADGVVESGFSGVDAALLTGEARPVETGVGDRVAAGSVSVTGVLRVRVSATGESTRVGRLMKLVEEASRRRAPIVQLADRIAGWFVGVMLVLAAATCGVWLLIRPEAAVGHAVALLIVACPCALGLSTPLALTVAIGRAARRGILIKGGDVLERLARGGCGRGTIFLDKTGTITESRLRVVRWFGDESARPLAASVERLCAHPIAKAIADGLAGDDKLPAASDVEQHLGGGVAGAVEGRRVVVGSPKWVREQAATPDWLDAAEREVLAEGLTPVLVAVNGDIVALAALGDAIRPDAHAAIRQLRGLGWRVAILSGDHPEVVQSVARQLAIDPADARGGVSPEDKLAVVTAESASGRAVVMVGDGVNDAAALAAASVGVAVHGGAEASLSAADVYIAAPGLRPLVELIGAARRTRRAITVALAASLAYNAVAVLLAMTGHISPLTAAVLMPLSSLTVLAIAYRVPTFARSLARGSGGGGA